LPIALDATYSLGRNLSGVGVYCSEILHGLARSHPEEEFEFWYRPHRILRSFKENLPANCRRRLLHDRWLTPRRADLFHGLNQRLPERRLERAITTFHDLFVMTGDYSTPEFRLRFTRLAKEAAARSDLIITVSQFTADQVNGLLKVPPSGIRVVHHGVRRLAPEETKREKIILHVGAIQQRKNIKRLVEAFEISAPLPWRLVLAGSAGFGAGEILSRIDQSAAQSRIDVLGFVDDSQLGELYGRASIFVFPSLDEGFGMPVLDAMAAGVPVICSNAAAMPEVVGDAAMMVDPHSTESIAGALERVIIDEAVRERLRSLGKNRASRFSWEKAVEETWGVYQELL
jgi:glycosyltransferase involved in cell wall biosynthesis